MTTTYTKRDIRAADMFAMILVGLGIAFAMFAVFVTVNFSGAEVGKPGKAVDGSGSTVGLWIGAVIFGSLGTSLNLKVRQPVRNKGREPGNYDGVPE